MLGDGGRPVPGTATATTDRTVNRRLRLGPTISVGGTVVRTSVTATARQLARGSR